VILTNAAVDRATTVLVLVVLIAILGTVAYLSLPREAAPDVTIPYILVTTTYKGVSPEDVEKSITIPIEKAIKGISDVEEIRSTSQEGVSIVQAEFSSNVDLDMARQKVDAKISVAKADTAWPEATPDLGEPALSEINLQEYPILWVNLRGGAWIDDLRFAGEDLERMAQLLEDRSVATDPKEFSELAGRVMERLDAAIGKAEGLSEKDLALLKLTREGTARLGRLVAAVGKGGSAGDAEALAALGEFLALHTRFADDLAAQLHDTLRGNLGSLAEGRTLNDIRTLAISRLGMAGVLCQNMAYNELLRLKDVGEDLEDRIETSPNVLNAEVVGGVEREIRVELDPDRLAAYHVPVAAVLALVAKENVSVTGGASEVGRSKFTLRFDAEFRDPGELMRLMVLAPNGKELYLTDVADVVFGFKEPTNHSRLNGVPSVTLSVQKRSGTNIIETADWCKRQVADYWEANRPVGIRSSYSGDQSKTIHMMVADLENNILTGMILVLGVIFISIGWRNAVFVGLAIPLSMMMGFAILQAMGVTLNLVVLFALTLALGMLVDNAIVIVENSYRHMQEGYPALEAAKRGAAQVAWPVISSTATTVAAFIPLLFWSGIVGQFMHYLPLTVITVLVSSLFVAVIINPAMCGRLMRLTRKSAGRSQEDSILAAVREGRPVASRTLRAYGAAIRWAIGHRTWTLLISLAALIVTGLLYASLRLEPEFFPTTDPNRGYVEVTAPEGTTLAATDAILRKVEQRVLPYLARPDESDPSRNIETVLTTAGFVGQGSFFGAGAVGSNEGRVTFEFIDFQLRKAPSAGTIEKLREAVRDIPGARIVVEQQRAGPPRDAPVVVEVSGDRFDTLNDLKDSIRRQIADTPGLVDLQDDYVLGRQEFRFHVDRQRSRYFGLDTSAVSSVIKTAVAGSKVGIWRDPENNEIDIVVRMKKQYRNNPNKIQQFYLTGASPTGTLQLVPLSNLATWEFSAGRGPIRRIDQKRTITISANNAAGFAPNAVLKAVQQRLERFGLPPGYSVEFTGEKEEQDKAQQFLAVAGIVGILLIWLILVTQFNSLTLPAVIMVAVVLSLIGVFFGLWITHTAFVVIMTGIGVISLAGVVVNNGIILIDYIRQLHRHHGLSLEQALVCGGMTRLRPVLLTAVTTVLGLVPMTTGVSFDFHNLQLLLRSESSEFWAPMANAVVFGLAFATALTLIVVPALYSLMEGAAAFFTPARRAERQQRRNAQHEARRKRKNHG
jgi:multidrug efflux pump subunit AcrB